MDVRLIVDGPGTGPWNMAVDEVLLESAALRGVASLRFYQWSEPTVSLGYFQPLALRAGIPRALVNRWFAAASGGGALVHDHELTYAFAGPTGDRFAGGACRALDMFHQSLIELLREAGVAASRCATSGAETRDEPFLCFQRRAEGDVLVGDAKIAGSAQRRRREALLQHGGVLLRRSRFAPELPGVNDLSATNWSASSLLEAWRPRLLASLGQALEPAELTADEVSRAKQLAQERFGHQAWTTKR